MININEKLNNAWAAGFIDGEGCILVKKTKKPKAICGYTYSILLTVGQVEITPLQKLQEMFLGSICKNKDAYYWTVSGVNALNCIKQIEEFLVCKREEALEALKFEQLLKPHSSHKLGENNTNTRELIYKNLQKMKRLKYGKSKN